MTNHEMIQRMNAEEMAAMIYIFLKPMMDTFKVTDDQKKQLKEQIRTFLKKEVQSTKNNGEVKK